MISPFRKLLMVLLCLSAGSAGVFFNPHPSCAQQQKVLVGTSMAPYALAYSPARHIFYHDGWYAFYHDGSNIICAYSGDGTLFSQHEIVSHIPVAVGFSAYEIKGVVYVFYTDTNYMKIFLRKGKAEHGKLSLGDPVLVIDTGVSFGATSPTLSVDAHGLLWVVYRSNEGHDQFRVWITSSQESDGLSWGIPMSISSSFEKTDSGAGTSGAPAVLSKHIIVVFSGARRLYMADMDEKALPSYRALKKLGTKIDRRTGSKDFSTQKIVDKFSEIFVRHSVIDDAFAGIHDFSLTTQGNSLHLAYIARDKNEGTVMSYKEWKPLVGWGRKTRIALSPVHTTALGKNTHGLYAFYASTKTGGESKIYCRSIDSRGASLGAEHQVGQASPNNNPTYLWVAASDSEARGVGVMWVEGVQAPYQVFFATTGDDE